ncbi:hypothetical protein WH50_12960 [Pokkaliibacter plantistimulans]|uniref:Uncharacterized protein n=1 Tax=Pokkaliibacter plantistimulans TaxID=1635171 RepID=A0ABX5LW38_9GAMM|nr:hypothetical protein [Pokkaliibacter plantistimulans]PXF30874.1 hypothetical protein WH50_12960 [Pokkaliibacter plantistimulans]
MANEHPPSDEQLWQEALDWLLKLHEQTDAEGEVRDQVLLAGLGNWLRQGSGQQQMFNQALTVWEATGMLPPGSMEVINRVLERVRQQL